MCPMIVKEIMLYYVTHHSPVFCTMLDATKAYDRVRYTKLFRLLLARRLPPVVVRVLFLYVHTQYCSSLMKWQFVQAFLCFNIKWCKAGRSFEPCPFLCLF